MKHFKLGQMTKDLSDHNLKAGEYIVLRDLEDGDYIVASSYTTKTIVVSSDYVRELDIMEKLMIVEYLNRMP